MTEDQLAAKYEVLLPHLDERARRLVLAADAVMLGRGGGRLVARAASVREATISAGVAELEVRDVPPGRVRRPGGGRKNAAEADRELVPALLELVEPDERGDPMSPLRWTTKSLRKLAAELRAQGHQVSPGLVGRLLAGQGFSMQGNAKVTEGHQHPDRDRQFRYINSQIKDHQAAADPVISVDTKKKEQVGPYANGGAEWRPKGEPARVRSHDFPEPGSGKAIPYGIYDISANTGWVNVGIDHDTAAFAVESLRRWWSGGGKADYPAARRLLITADAGGSNSARVRAWKTELAAFAAETGLAVTVCHFPPGTSKWNKIEHRLFSHITLNWRGRPLTSHQVVVNTIASTTTTTGLRVHAELDQGTYPTGIEISNTQLAQVPLHRHPWHGEWNYTIHPTPPPDPPQSDNHDTQPSPPDLAWLHAPALSGLSATRFDQLTAELQAAHHAQREARLAHRRRRPRKTAPGSGRTAKLTLADHLAITLLYQRFSPLQRTLAHLYGVTPTTINRIIKQTRPLLTLTHTTPQPTGTHLPTPTDITTYATNHGITTSPPPRVTCY